MPEPSTDKTIPVRVSVRVRPLLPKEIGEGCQECINLTPGEPQVVMGSDKAFTYDYVYGTGATQSELYRQTVGPLIDGLFKGYNATVLAYGQTGSGKTFSMGTSFTSCSNTENKEIQGVIPRVISDIFDHVDKKKEETEFLLKCSFLEIHNEEIHDLLNPASYTDKIAIREDVDGGIKIAGLSELPVSFGEEMMKLLCVGSASRATGATSMNLTSSRSHAIFSIIMEQKDKTGEGDFRRAKFHLVDLAGSERAKRTNAQGERFKEGVNINKGLLALGNVISALSDEQRKSNAHVPYRDSKLTRLLQDSLGGNSNTVMIACVSPADSNYEETLNTLRYADRARQIKNKPIVNRDPVAAEMAKLKQQVQMLQVQLLQGQTINGGLTDIQGNNMGFNLQEITERVRQLEEENLKLSQELHNSVNQNTTMYEKILMAELTRDKIIRQYDELKHYLTDQKVKLMPSLTESTAEPAEETNLATELQKKFQQFEESCTVAPEQHNDSQGSINHDNSCEVESMEQDNSPGSSPVMNSSYESQHALRQAELGRQVQQLTKALALKEELAMKMQQNEGTMSEKMVKQYEVTVRDLESEIGKLEKEKSSLAHALSAAKNTEGNSKGRFRIKELETQIIQLKKKQVELQKLQRLKQQGDATITKLNTEMQSMKSVRVKLMRQMKEESDKFRILKKEKEKEIIQLKQTDRKRQFEYCKLQNIHQKQQNVLKRKTEEVASANKRLHEALSKRKEAAEKRDNFKNIENKLSEGLIPRMKSWLSHEVEVLASIAHAKKTLEELIEDRKTSSQEISELRGQRENDEPPAKKMSMNEGDGEKNEEREEAEAKMKIKSLEAELTIKTSQIAELQRKLVDAESHVSVEKSKHRWSNIHTMAEAKASLQVLLSMAVNTKSRQIKMEKNIEGDTKELEELRASTEVLITNHRKQLEFLRSDYDRRTTTIQKEHEDKVLLILQQMPSEEEKAEVSRLRELILVKDNELSERQQQNDMLQQRFAALSEALSNETPSNSMIETASETPSKEEDIIVLDIEDEEEIVYLEEPEEEEELIDNIENDPDWVKTPRVIRWKKKSIEQDSAGCLCVGKCVRNCMCRTNTKQCGIDCKCKSQKCSNRPKDPKTPILFESSDSDLSIEQENVSSALTSKPANLKQDSKEKQVLTAANSKGTPTSRLPKKSNISKPRGRENKLPSFSSSNKIRRKSIVISKKQGIKSTAAHSVMMTPHRGFLKTPGSGFTPSRTVKTPKMHSNMSATKKKVDAKSKQRKRKLHNPTSQLPPFVS